MISESVFVDSSWFKALLDVRDDFHTDALQQFGKFREKNIFLVTSNFIVDETLTLIRVKSGLETALKFRDKLLEMSDVLKVVRILPQDEKMAWRWFPENWSKLSFTDCTSFAVMKRLELKEAAAFDRHFTQAGFKVFLKPILRRRRSRQLELSKQ